MKKKADPTVCVRFDETLTICLHPRRRREAEQSDGTRPTSRMLYKLFDSNYRGGYHG